MGKYITEPFIIRVTLREVGNPNGFPSSAKPNCHGSNRRFEARHHGRVLTGEELFLQRTPDKPDGAEIYALKAGNRAVLFTPQEVSLIEGGRP